MKIYGLKNKIVLKFIPNAAEFIKQFSTNTPEASQGAFIDIHGRIVAVFDQKKLSQDESWVVIEKQFLERLKKHLEKYLTLNDTLVQVLAHKVYFDLEGSYRCSGDEVEIPQRTGKLIVTSEELPCETSEDEFRLFRLEHHIPVQGIDFDQDMVLNPAVDEWISYSKGCYLGQEIVARVHFRAKPPKKLVVLSAEEREIVFLTSQVKDPVTQKTIGFTFVDNP